MRCKLPIYFSIPGLNNNRVRKYISVEINVGIRQPNEFRNHNSHNAPVSIYIAGLIRSVIRLINPLISQVSQVAIAFIYVHSFKWEQPWNEFIEWEK